MCIPADTNEADIEAARKAYFSVPTAISGRLTSLGGATPPCSAAILRTDSPTLNALPRWENDLPLIHQPLDFYAQNIYNGRVIRAADNAQGYEQLPEPVGVPRTAIGWSIHPDALYWGPKFLYERYKTPFIISENGMSAHDARFRSTARFTTRTVRTTCTAICSPINALRKTASMRAAILHGR